MLGKLIGSSIAAARDALGRGLVAAGVTPNTLTFAGMLLTAAAGVCYAVGAAKPFAWALNPLAERNAYLLLAGGLMLLAAACDMLDGAVARFGGKATRFGAFLDSTLDRFSDFAVYAGIAVAYALHHPGNVTFVLLSMLCFFNAYMISYAKARAEDFIESCKVGYWQRGERSTAVLIATFAHNIPALLAQQALLPAFTVLRRILHTRATLKGRAPARPRQGGDAPNAKHGVWRPRLLMRLRLWRYPRASRSYDIVTALNIAWLILAPVPEADVLRLWLAA